MRHICLVLAFHTLLLDSARCFHLVVPSPRLRSTAIHVFQIEESQRTWTHGSTSAREADSASQAPPGDLLVSTTPTRRRFRKQKTKPMPVTGYDARAIEEFYDMRPLQVGWRLNSLGFPLLGKSATWCCSKCQIRSYLSPIQYLRSCCWCPKVGTLVCSLTSCCDGMATSLYNAVEVPSCATTWWLRSRWH